MATINYKGMELEEITEPQIFDPPQEMLVWDFESCSSNAISKKKVLAIFPNKNEYRQNEIKPVLATDGTKWNFCANVPAPRRATWEQLAYWLIDGKGLVLDADTNRVDTGVYFDMKNMHEEVGERYYVMARGESMWHEPTVDYMGLEEA